MFRKRLLIALAVLAAAAVAQGLVAVWALGVAERHVQRGRVASDIQLGFAHMSVAKQRLRGWLLQMKSGAGGEPVLRDRYQEEMRQILSSLQALSRRAVELDNSDGTRMEHVQRQDSLAVLARSLDELDQTVMSSRPLDRGVDMHFAWLSVEQIFDQSQGRDLRGLIAQSIAREAAAVQRERAAADDALRWMRSLWLGTAAAVALAALLLAGHFARALRRPLDRLTQGAQALQHGDLAHRITADGADEFSVVARSFNAMAEEIAQHRAREDLARQQLEALVSSRTAELQSALEALQEMDRRRRQLYADISHELRTPTTAIRGEAEITLRGRDRGADEYKAALTRIVDTSRQLGLVIEDLLTMTRSDADALSLHRRNLDMATPMDDALAQARALAHERQISIEAKSWPRPLPVEGDPLRLRQIIMVLLDNAVRYSRAGSVVRVCSRAVMDENGRAGCEVEVHDQGIGIPQDELGHVFERNFRGSRARRHRADGSGLGLSIGLALAQAHGGDITLSTSPEGGTVAVFRLPLRTEVRLEANSA